MTARQRAEKKPPYRMLALDGGGVRGALTIEVLAKVESFAAEKGYQTLADYFDYISGTSTGAILAAALSLGWRVDRLRDFYATRGEEMFDKAAWLKRLKYKYEAQPLRDLLRTEFRGREDGDVLLGSDEIRTLLMLVMRNATTDSPWLVSNNPKAIYNDRTRDDCNLNIPLWQLVRASTAAPIYFPPQHVQVGDKHFLFVDGGITPYNNPAFQMFLMATIEPYGLNWEAGEDKMLVVSIGTGTNPNANADLSPGDMNLLYNAGTVPSALMFAALNEQDFLCRTFGKCLAGDPIDQEIGDMRQDNGSRYRGPVDPKLFTYLRYNAELTRDGLDKLGLGHIEPEEVQKLDSIKGIPKLQEVGRALAEKAVQAQHFAGF